MLNDYVILEARSANELSALALGHILALWKPAGGVTVYVDDIGVRRFCQAFVK